MTVWAIVKLQKEGFHYYKNAADEVAFLRNKHRHIFFITVYVEQEHNERDVEYIWLKHVLEQNIPKIDGPESCETIATNIKKLVESLFEIIRKVKI